jgi:hypothetical protein
MMSKRMNRTPHQFELPVALTRASMGALLLLAPRLGARMWIGDHAHGSGRAVARWLGVRDLALAASLLRLRTRPPHTAQLFLEAAAVDVTDALVTVRMRRDLPGAWWPVIAGGAAAMAIADATLSLRAAQGE